MKKRTATTRYDVAEHLQRRAGTGMHETLRVGTTSAHVPLVASGIPIQGVGTPRCDMIGPRGAVCWDR
jgi:hypothetical protein